MSTSTPRIRRTRDSDRDAAPYQWPYDGALDAPAPRC